MRKIYLLSVTIVYLFISACSTSKDNFAQRKYFDHYFSSKQKVKTIPVEQEIVIENSFSSEFAAEEASIEPKANPIFPEEKENVVVAKNKRVNKVKDNVREIAAQENIIQEQRRSATVVKAAELRSVLKEAKKRRIALEETIPFILLVILAIILPPLAVFIKEGIDTPFWISLVLTLLFWLPGVIYALYIIFK